MVNQPSGDLFRRNRRSGIDPQDMKIGHSYWPRRPRFRRAIGTAVAQPRRLRLRHLLIVAIVLLSAMSATMVVRADEQERSGQPSLRFPFPGGETREISQEYGSGSHQGKDEYALDFNLPGTQDLGTPVVAAASGEVMTVSYSGSGDDCSLGHTGYGWRVDVDHGDGYVTRYAHLQTDPRVTPGVLVGQPVTQGMVIGKVGCSGQATGPHLHFALYKDGAAALPEPMSGYVGLVDGASYTSDNYQKALVTADGTAVYWVQNGVRYHVAGPEILSAMADGGIPAWGWDLIGDIAPAQLDSYIEGPEMVVGGAASGGLLLRRWTQAAGGTDVFLMDSGRDRHIKNPTAFNQYGFSWENIVDAAPVVLQIPADGSVIYAVGQVDANREAISPAFILGWATLSADAQASLGYAREWVKNDGFASPVSGIAGARQAFDNGSLQLRQGDSQAYSVAGMIWDCWSGATCSLTPNPYSGSWLGWPRSNAYAWSGGLRQEFEGGYISWTPAEGARANQAGAATNPTPTVSPSPTPSPMATPMPSPTPTSTATPTPSPTPAPTAAPIPSPMPTLPPTPTPGPKASPTPSPMPTLLPTPTPGPKASPAPSPTPAPTAAPIPSPMPTSSPTPTAVDEAATVESPSPILIGLKGFRQGPVVRLRPVNDVVTTEEDGIVELFLSNPSVNDVSLSVDVFVSVPSGLHIYGEGFGQSAGAGTVASNFKVLPGTSRTIVLNIKAARTGRFLLHFSGQYWPGENKDLFNPVSLTHSFLVEEPSPDPLSPELTSPQQLDGDSAGATSAPTGNSERSNRGAACSFSPAGSSSGLTASGDFGLLGVGLLGLLVWRRRPRR